jgi:hypothetical protein
MNFMSLGLDAGARPEEPPQAANTNTTEDNALIIVRVLITTSWTLLLSE